MREKLPDARSIRSQLNKLKMIRKQDEPRHAPFARTEAHRGRLVQDFRGSTSERAVRLLPLPEDTASRKVGSSEKTKTAAIYECHQMTIRVATVNRSVSAYCYVATKFDCEGKGGSGSGWGWDWAGFLGRVGLGWVGLGWDETEHC